MAYAELSSTADPYIIVNTQWTEKELVKSIPGARWDTTGRVWTLPLAWASCVTLRGVFGEALHVGEHLTQWAWQHRRDFTEPALALRAKLGAPYGTLAVDDERLYDFQRAGVDFITHSPNVLLGDEMGTGKTIQTLVALRQHPDALPALVICPNSVKRHWAREAATWLPEATPYVVGNTAAKRRNVIKDASSDPTALVIINIEAVALTSRVSSYGSIKLKRCRECDPNYGDESVKASRCEVHHKELNGFGFKTVVFDEAHRIKNPQATQTRAAWSVMHEPSVTRRVALTGTPIAQHPGDLWSIMHAVAPAEFPVRGKFIDRYCTPPDSLVWMADGSFKQIGEIRVDDKVMGFSKTPIDVKGKHPHYEPTRVLAVNRREAELIRVHTDRGDSFLCTPDHQWLTGFKRKPNNGSRIMEFSTAQVGTTLRHVIDVPSDLPNHLRAQAAWLAGVYDGEGTHMRIAQYRYANPEVYAEIGRVLDLLGLPYAANDFGYRLVGGRDIFFKFLHWCKPIKRWTEANEDKLRSSRYMFRGALSGSGRQNKVTITKIEPAGVGQVVSLSTEHQTYIVHGYASHNCLTSWNLYGGIDIVGVHPAQRDELFSFLDPHFRRVTKAEVLPQLPKKVRTTRLVELTAAQRRMYREIEEKLQTRTESGELFIVPSDLHKALRLMQLASATCEIEYPPDDPAGWKIRMRGPSPKVDELVVVLDELGDQQCVVAAESIQLIKLAAEKLAKLGIPYGLVTGEQSEYDRDQALLALREKRIRVLLFTVKAGGTGLNMSCVSTLVNLQRSWSMIDVVQTEDRVHRIGSEQHDHIQIIDIITEGTIEEDQLERIGVKFGKLDEITRDRARLVELGLDTTEFDERYTMIMKSHLGTD